MSFQVVEGTMLFQCWQCGGIMKIESAADADAGRVSKWRRRMVQLGWFCSSDTEIDMCPRCLGVALN